MSQLITAREKQPPPFGRLAPGSNHETRPARPFAASGSLHGHPWHPLDCVLSGEIISTRGDVKLRRIVAGAGSGRRSLSLAPMPRPSCANRSPPFRGSRPRREGYSHSRFPMPTTLGIAATRASCRVCIASSATARPSDRVGALDARHYEG